MGSSDEIDVLIFVNKVIISSYVLWVENIWVGSVPTTVKVNTDNVKKSLVT